MIRAKHARIKVNPFHITYRAYYVVRKHKLIKLWLRRTGVGMKHIPRGIL